ncbi:MAG: type II secretion system F family protein [Candidatus Gracilibacteria bacterium]|nr:type II secretion system F family protein [Candidatus Gracilibacteria bacterium]
MYEIDTKSSDNGANKGIFDEIYLIKRVSLVDKYNFYDYIGMMIDGGISISEALNGVTVKISNTYFVSKIKELNMYISSGDSFSKAMKKIPSIFLISEIAIVESGETTGDLHNAFLKLSDDFKKVHNLQLKVKGALTYPIIILVFLFVAVVIVLTYVIPAILPVFTNSGVDLPLATVMLINTSDFIVNNFVSLFFLLFAFVIGFAFYKNTNSGKLTISHFILSFPLIGNIYRNYLLSVFASNLGTLMSSGIPIIKALNLTSKSLNNLEYQNLITKISSDVSNGSKITDAMQIYDKEGFYFPADFVQLFSVGEKTASIDVVTKKINSQYVIEVDNSLSSLTKWIEPIAILIAGLFVVWFAFAIFGAILKVTQTVS